MNFDLLQNILLVSPGFFGIAANKLFDGDAEKVNLQNDVLRYFLYNAAAWAIASELLPAVAAASVLGALWPLVLKGAFINLANRLHELRGQNPITLHSNMLDYAFADGQHHYLKIYKNGQKVAEGIFEHLITPENSIAVISDKGWAEWFAQNEHAERCIAFADSDMYIIECVFPQ